MMLNLWTAEKERLSTLLLTAIAGEADHVSAGDVLKKPLPELLHVYVRRHVKRRLKEEQIVSYQPSASLVVDEALVRAKVQKLTDELVPHVFLNRDELGKLIQKVLSFQIDILVRPRQKLTEILFSRADTRKIEDVLEILDKAHEDRPFMLSLIRSVRKMSQDEISKAQFVALAQENERAAYAEKPLSTIMRDIHLYLEFVSSLSPKADRLMSSSILLALLAERGLDAMRTEFEQEAREKAYWTVEEIESALQRHILVGDYQEAGADTTGTSTSEEAQTPPVVVNFVPEKSSIDLGIEGTGQATEPVDFKIRFEESFEKAADASEEEGESTTEQPDRLQVAHDNNVPQEKARAESPKESFLRVWNSIDQQQKKILLDKIFNRSERECRTFFERVEHARIWNEAKMLIDEELEKRQISVNADEALLLGDVIFSRFHVKSEP